MNNPVTKSVAVTLRYAVATLVAFALFAPRVQAQVPTTAKGAEHSKQVAEFLQKRRQSPFNLNAAAPNVLLAVNQFQCAVRSNGDTCADLNNSPINPGGFWPVGTPNQYMFNSGINIAGIIPSGLGFPWSGDTVAAYFFDATGTQAHGTPLTDIFDSLNPSDLANWPEAGFLPDFPIASGIITDTDIFSDVLVGRKNASQQDSYFVIWDGDPSANARRNHPMGILVEQRTMAWNYPAGNEATIFFVYKVTNVTNSAKFQQLNEAQFFGGQNRLPDAGWRIDSIYLAYDSDPDVTVDAGDNFGSAILPLNLMLAYSGDFVANEMIYRTDIFFPPFFTNAPGIVGIKYLKSPRNPRTGQEVGLTMFTAHTNGGAFPDPLGPQKLYRYWSGDLRPALGDPACTFPDPRVRGYCYLPPSRSDVRVAAASGPFSIEPGQSVTIVAAMYAAATVNTPLIIRGTDNVPGTPSRHPGCGGDIVRPIEVAAGWLGATCPADPSAPVVQSTIRSVPGSLVGKGLQAQAVFDAKFLLPSAPVTPEYNLVPGDHQVTVIWSASPTDSVGDPFFAAASKPLPNELRDLNFRRFDVEGYRIYKGTQPSNLRLIAQFDKAGTSLIDFTCATDPEFVIGDVCPPDGHEVLLTGAVVQFPAGGVVRLADGSAIVIRADTAGQSAVAAGNARALEDTGVPFAFIDSDVRNGFRYFYKVTAFDINSLKSGPTSLESSGTIKNTTPQKSAMALELAQLTQVLSGTDNVALNPNGPLPTINAATGTFSGKMPPTNGIDATFSPLVERLLPAFKLEATIDSIVNGNEGMVPNPCVNGSSAHGACWTMYMTFNKDGRITKSVSAGFTPLWTGFGENAAETWPMGSAAVAADSAALTAFGVKPGFVSFQASLLGTFPQIVRMPSAEGHLNRRTGGCTAGAVGSATCLQYAAGGARWFSGTNETEPDPSRFARAGRLPGVDSIFMVVHHMPQGPGLVAPAGALSTPGQCFPSGAASMERAADVAITWGAGGTITSVRDLTHNVDVRFSPNPNPTYGFFNSDANGNNVIDWEDFNYLNVIAQLSDEVLGFCAPGGVGGSHENNIKVLERTPRVQPVNTTFLDPTGMPVSGQGFGLYINGYRFIFRLTGGAFPAAGTVWTLRTYAGRVRASTNTNTLDPGGYTYVADVRPPMVPGLKFVFESKTASTLVAGSEDITKVHTVPDPYYGTSLFDLAPTSQKQLQFVNVPAGATIRIYSLSGILVDVLNHVSPSGGGQLNWDLRNRSGQFVGSGVYLFHVSLPDGRKHTGKFTVINSGS